MDRDNPAARLYEVFSYLKAAPGNGSIQDALNGALGLPADRSPVEFYRQISVMMAWPDSAKAQIESLPNQSHDLLLRWYDPITTSMQYVGKVHDAVSGMTAHVSDRALGHLEHAADTLSRSSPEPMIADDKLPDLINHVRTLIDKVTSNEDLPPNARHLLITRLRGVEQALLHFRITGYDGVEEAMDCLIGGYIRHPETRTPERDNWFSGLWAKITLTLIGVKEISDTGSSIFKAIEDGRNTLGR